ncbi:MAG TPA: hypothetical protein VH280_10850 [Verrucomicrobiae bacterium]|nr:hypothetical protein [Verrucomicrobiae bacterium]
MQGIGLSRTIFPCSNHCRCNSHFLGKLWEREPFLIPFDLNEVTERLYARGQRLAMLPLGRNMVMRHPDLAMGNTQRGYSPAGEGELAADELAGRSTIAVQGPDACERAQKGPKNAYFKEKPQYERKYYSQTR